MQRQQYRLECMVSVRGLFGLKKMEKARVYFDATDDADARRQAASCLNNMNKPQRDPELVRVVTLRP